MCGFVGWMEDGAHTHTAMCRGACLGRHTRHTGHIICIYNGEANRCTCLTSRMVHWVVSTYISDSAMRSCVLVGWLVGGGGENMGVSQEEGRET